MASASASVQSRGPEMWCTVRCPSESRCSTASRAPSRWSTATHGTTPSSTPSTLTAGTPGFRAPITWAADRSGARMITPSTDWSTSRCTEARRASVVSRCALATLTK